VQAWVPPELEFNLRLLPVDPRLAMASDVTLRELDIVVRPAADCRRRRHRDFGRSKTDDSGITAASPPGIITDEVLKCDAKWLPPTSVFMSGAPNVMLIGDSISKGNSGYSLYVRDILQRVLPSGLAGDSASLVGTLMHGGGFGSDGQAAASQQGAAKVGCYDGNGTGSLAAQAWSVLTYNAGLHDCGRGSSQWVDSTAYERNLRRVFGAMKRAATAAIFVATTPFDLRLPINYTAGITPQCVAERNGIAKRVAAEMGVAYDDLHAFVNAACLGANYTECAFQTTGLHFFTRAPLPSGQQLTAISVANAVIRSLDHSELSPAPPSTAVAQSQPRAYPWIFRCGLSAKTPPTTAIEDGHGRWHNVTIPQVLVIGDSISSDAEGYGAELREIMENPLPWCGANMSIPSSEPADATGFCSARTGRGGPIRPFDAKHRTATGALARVSHSGGWKDQKGNEWQAGNSSHGKACAKRWLGAQRFDVITINFGLHDCGCRNASDAPGPFEPCSGNLRFGRAVSAADYAKNLLAVYEAASAALNTGGKIVYVPTTPGGEAYSSTVSNPCIRDVNAIAQRVLGGKPDVVMADLHAAVDKACGGADYARCKLQNTHDGHHFTKAGQTFTAVVVAHAIAPLLGPRWMAILRQLSAGGDRMARKSDESAIERRPAPDVSIISTARELDPAALILRRHIRARSAATTVGVNATGGGVAVRLALGASLGAEAYEIADAGTAPASGGDSRHGRCCHLDGAYYISTVINRAKYNEGRQMTAAPMGPGHAVLVSGGDARGVLFGVGALLRDASFGAGGFAPGPRRGGGAPALPNGFRAMYLATHLGDCGPGRRCHSAGARAYAVGPWLLLLRDLHRDLAAIAVVFCRNDSAAPGQATTT
jgi:hypothetical protein